VEHLTVPQAPSFQHGSEGVNDLGAQTRERTEENTKENTEKNTEANTEENTEENTQERLT
jgi:hypothetical protein